MLSLIYFLIVLSILILVHEFGHFITAKRLGVRVEKFSFGFGPKIFSIKKGETEYLISSIPLGGYVKMAGEEPQDELAHQPWEFPSKTVSERFRIIFAGPLLNYLLAFLVFSGIYMFGSPTMTTEVGGLLKGYPAEGARIAVGDKILAVDGKPVKYWEDMTEIIRKKVEGSLNLSIERSGKTFEAKIKPVVRRTKDIFGNEIAIALVGIAQSQKIEKVRYGPFKSFYMGFKKLMHLTFVTYKSIFAIVTGRLSLKESMTGPIGIFVITGKAAELGFIYLFHLIGILSASLAIFNLLPLPIVDGGHIMLLGLEKLRGRPLSTRSQEVTQNIGIGFLILLTVVVLYNDMVNFGVIEKFKASLRGAIATKQSK